MRLKIRGKESGEGDPLTLSSRLIQTRFSRSQNISSTGLKRYLLSEKCDTRESCAAGIDKDMAMKSRAHKTYAY